MNRKGLTSVIAGALACVLCLTLLPGSALAAGGLDNFKRTGDYPAGKFTDVAASA